MWVLALKRVPFREPGRRRMIVEIKRYANRRLLSWTGCRRSSPVQPMSRLKCDAGPSNSGTATATDNCDTSPAITYSDAVVDGSCAGSSVITRTWIATDRLWKRGPLSTKPLLFGIPRRQSLPVRATPPLNVRKVPSLITRDLR